MTKNTEQKIETHLEHSRFQHLTLEEKERAWQSVSSSLEYSSLLGLRQSFMISTLLVLVLLAGGTAVAADDAKPGDLLYEIDRTVEDIQLALADDETDDDIKLQIAEERLSELDELFDDRVNANFTNVTEIEADIFTDKTVVKLEVGEKHYIYTTGADTREELVEEISARYEIPESTVEDILEVETEDRASRLTDIRSRGSIVLDNDERDQEVIEDTAAFLVRLENEFEAGDNEAAREEIRAYIASLETQVGTFNNLKWRGENGEQVDIRSLSGDRERIEIRDEDNNQIRIETKSDGEVRIKTSGSDKEDWMDDDDDKKIRENSNRGHGYNDERHDGRHDKWEDNN